MMATSVAGADSVDVAAKGQKTPGLTNGHLALAVLDYLVTLGVLAPLVVSYWRGTWQLLDTNFFEDRPLTSAWSSIGIGSGLNLIFYWLQEDLHQLLVPEDSAKSVRGWKLWRYMLFSRFYTAVFCFASVNHWRGVWTALDLHWGIGAVSCATSAAIGMAFLAALGVLRNVLAPPLGLLIDAPKTYFRFSTMFNTQKIKGSGIHLLDCVFSVGIVGSLVVFSWRGAWQLLEIYLFPERPSLSAWGSLALGYSTSLLSLAMQHPLSTLALRIPNGRWRLIVMDLLVSLGFFGTVNLWRGVWNLSNIYLLPDYPETSNWISHGVGLVCMVVFYGGNSIMVRGVLFDSDLPYLEEEHEDSTSDREPSDPVFSVQYLRYFVSQARKKRRWRKRRRKGDEEEPEEPELTVKMLVPVVDGIVTKDIPNNLQQHGDGDTTP